MSTREESISSLLHSIANVNLRLLRRQNLSLIKAIDYIAEKLPKNYLIGTSTRSSTICEDLKGILHLLDVITDFILDNPEYIEELKRDSK